MDPNEALKELLELSEQVLHDIETLPEPANPSEIESNAALMAERIQALDMWIRGGGFFPSRWRTPR